MGININLPKITATDPSEQIRQMHSYLFQVTEQLNWALSTIETSINNGVSSAVKFEHSEDISPQEAESTFNSIKALITKSADIVQAYEETIMSDFNGRYFADSDFGSYLEQTARSIEENSKGVNEVYTNVQTISGKVDDIEEETVTTNAYIKRGLLGYHERLKKDAYGIAVGQTDDNGVYKRYAWFISEGLCLFDENDNEVAYISQNKLYITDAAFLGTVQFGGYKVDTSDGMAFTWIG